MMSRGYLTFVSTIKSITKMRIIAWISTVILIIIKLSEKQNKKQFWKVEYIEIWLRKCNQVKTIITFCDWI